MKVKEYLEYHNLDTLVDDDVNNHEIEMILPPPSKFQYEEPEEGHDGEHTLTNTTRHITTEFHIDEKLRSGYMLRIDDRKPLGENVDVYQLGEKEPMIYI